MNANHKLSRVALVTGAGRRVGRAIAIGLADSGYRIGAHYNGSVAGAEETLAIIEERGGDGTLLKRDLSQVESAGQLVLDARAALGPVNVLINSASSFAPDSIETLTPESWQELVNVNLAAPVFLMQEFARQNPSPPDAAIINMLDTQMTSAAPERFTYFCSKFGLDGATRLAAFDLARKGVTVNAIAPGLILPSEQTEAEFLHRQELTPMRQGLGAADIVDAVRYLIGARHVTGHTLVVDSGQRLMGFGNSSFGLEEAADPVKGNEVMSNRNRD
ncbi:MAG: SDR family NAD(P)-dependent oxidoreductase [Hyphomicrobiaceae bacterium]